jgi:hypothetical protein
MSIFRLLLLEDKLLESEVVQAMLTNSKIDYGQLKEVGLGDRSSDRRNARGADRRR